LCRPVLPITLPISLTTFLLSSIITASPALFIPATTLPYRLLCYLYYVHYQFHLLHYQRLQSVIKPKRRRLITKPTCCKAVGCIIVKEELLPHITNNVYSVKNLKSRIFCEKYPLLASGHLEGHKTSFLHYSV